MTAAADRDPQALLHAALAKAQGEFPPVTRDREVEVQMKGGGKYTFSYAELSGVIAITRPALVENGLAVTQFLTCTDDGRPAVTTALLHEAGGLISGTIPIRTDGMSPQEVGSLITYIRRYSYCAALGIAPERDDDGRQATIGHTRQASNGRTSEPKVTKRIAEEIERLIDTLNETGALGEVEIRDGMQSAYGTAVTAELTKSQAENLKARLEAKAPTVTA